MMTQVVPVYCTPEWRRFSPGSLKQPNNQISLLAIVLRERARLSLLRIRPPFPLSGLLMHTRS